MLKPTSLTATCLPNDLRMPAHSRTRPFIASDMGWPPAVPTWARNCYSEIVFPTKRPVVETLVPSLRVDLLRHGARGPGMLSIHATRRSTATLVVQGATATKFTGGSRVSLPSAPNFHSLSIHHPDGAGATGPTRVSLTSRLSARGKGAPSRPDLFIIDRCGRLGGTRELSAAPDLNAKPAPK